MPDHPTGAEPGAYATTAPPWLDTISINGTVLVVEFPQDRINIGLLPTRQADLAGVRISTAVDVYSTRIDLDRESPQYEVLLHELRPSALRDFRPDITPSCRDYQIDLVFSDGSRKKIQMKGLMSYGPSASGRVAFDVNITSRGTMTMTMTEDGERA